MTAKERPTGADWVKAVLVVFVFVLFLGVAYADLSGWATRSETHQQTLNAIKAENCTSAKCESPAVKAVISQAIAGIVAAVSKDDAADQQLLCASLASLNVANPSTTAVTALRRYCQPSTSTGGTP